MLRLQIHSIRTILVELPAQPAISGIHWGALNYMARRRCRSAKCRRAPRRTGQQSLYQNRCETELHLPQSEIPALDRSAAAGKTRPEHGAMDNISASVFRIALLCVIDDAD